MKNTLVFDVYGTLIDPMGVIAALEVFVGDGATDFASHWRNKQVEYLFRRGLGRKYQPFSVCTRQALEQTCLATGYALNDAEQETILDTWLSLPAFPDASETLANLGDAGFECYAFSNGEPGGLATLLANAGLADLLQGIISVHEVQSFKPDPSVYAFFLENTGAMLGHTWLVSGNPFDVIGALEVGWKAVWVQRDREQVFDPWGITPTATVGGLSELRDALP
jgi:2-haloacid dehalogenase